MSYSSVANLTVVEDVVVPLDSADVVIDPSKLVFMTRVADRSMVMKTGFGTEAGCYASGLFISRGEYSRYFR